MRRQAAGSNQFIAGVPSVELADGQRRAMNGRWSADDGDTGAIGKAGIQDRILAREVLSQEPCDALNRRLQPVVRVRGRQRDMLNDPSTIYVPIITARSSSKCQGRKS